MAQIYVVGHKNPDNDSIMAAYTYANLKNMTDADNEYIPARLGELPAESAMIFEEYGIEAPCTHRAGGRGRRARARRS